jgi:hypothetical protein
VSSPDHVDRGLMLIFYPLARERERERKRDRVMEAKVGKLLEKIKTPAQRSVLRCSLMQFGAIWRFLVKFAEFQRSLVQLGAVWCRLVEFGGVWCSLLQFFNS